MGLLTKLLITTAIKSAADITCSVADMAGSVADMKRAQHEKEAAYARASANNVQTQAQKTAQSKDRMYELDLFYAKIALISFIARADNVISTEEVDEFNQMLAVAGDVYGFDAVTKARQIFNNESNSFMVIETYFQKVQERDLDSLLFYAENFANTDNRITYEEKQAVGKIRSYIESRKGKKTHINLVCPGCGGNLRPDAYGYKAVCEFCGREAIININNSPNKTEAPVKCASCGQSLAAFDNPRKFTFCPFCGGKVNNVSTANPKSDNKPNLYIAFTTTDSSVGMEVKVSPSGQKNTLTNGQSMPLSLTPGKYTVQLKIGKETFGKSITIAANDSPVMIYASYNGKAEVFVHQTGTYGTQATESQEDFACNENEQNKAGFSESFNKFTSDVSGAFQDAVDSFNSSFKKVKNSHGASASDDSPNLTQTKRLFTKKEITVISIATLIILAAVIIPISITFVGRLNKGSNIQNSTVKVANYKLYLDISSESNLIFSKYDISVSLDGKELGSVANGGHYTSLCEVQEGKHEIVFCKAGNSSPKETKQIMVSNDTTYSCELSHSSSSIDIKNEKITDNIAGSSLEVPDVRGMILSVAITKLKDMGFTNMREEPYSSIWVRDNWIVSGQGINPGTKVDKNEFIQLDCIGADSYFEKLFVGKNISEIQKIANGKGYTLSFKEAYYDNMDTSKMADEIKQLWVATSTLYNGYEKNVQITVTRVENEKATGTSIESTTTESSLAGTTSETKSEETVSSSDSSGSESSESSKFVPRYTQKIVTYISSDGTSSKLVYDYDSLGNVIRMSSYGTNGIYEGCSEYEYDSKGNMIKRTVKKQNNEIDWTEEYEYDGKGNVKGWEKHYTSGRNRLNYRWFDLEYDANGRLIKKTGKGKYGTTGWEEYEYDKSGNLAKKTVYDTDWKLDCIYQYSYDKTGKMVKELYYDENRKLKNTYKYTYDNNGNLSAKIELNNKGKEVTRTTYQYDEYGREIKQIYGSGRIETEYK